MTAKISSLGTKARMESVTAVALHACSRDEKTEISHRGRLDLKNPYFMWWCAGHKISLLENVSIKLTQRYD